MEKENKDVVSEELKTIRSMPGTQRLESDLLQSSITLTQDHGPQVHGPLPHFDQVQDQVPQGLGPSQVELGCPEEPGPAPRELCGPCGTELPQEPLPIVPVLPDHSQRAAASAEAQTVPPAQIMASYRTMTTTVSGGKRTLRQTGQVLEAMFTNTGLHPMAMTRTSQTIGLDVPDDSHPGGAPFIPGQLNLKQVMSPIYAVDDDQPGSKRQKYQDAQDNQPNDTDTFNDNLRRFKAELVEEMTEKVKVQVDQSMIQIYGIIGIQEANMNKKILQKVQELEKTLTENQEVTRAELLQLYTGPSNKVDPF